MTRYNLRNTAGALLIAFSLAVALTLSAGGCKKKKDDPFIPLPWGGGGNYGDYAAGTDKWFLDYDNAAFYSALTVAGIPAGDAANVKTAIMDYLNSYFTGVQISFAETPLPDGETPAPGDLAIWYSLPSHSYNTMAIRNLGIIGAVTGRSIRDISTLNEYLENDSAQASFSGEELGIFIDAYAEVFASSAMSGIDRFSRFLASLIAHEIGHSLGLDHNDDTTNIMNTSTTLSPALMPSLAAEDVTFLMSVLPGPGRD
ncbi:MAG: matrixin family metalloprotease [Planctomycetota bacterium]|jgi:hypothetical protein